MPFFDDRGFYKRAQITANDLQLAGVVDFRGHRPPDDLRRQPRPPRPAHGRRAHLLRRARRAQIDAGVELTAGGEFERELRGCAVHACERLATRLGVPPGCSTTGSGTAASTRPTASAPRTSRTPSTTERMDAFEGHRRRSRVPDVHRHRPRRRGAARVPRRVHHAGEHRPAAVHRVPLAQEPHLPRRPRRGAARRARRPRRRRRTSRSSSAARPSDEIDKFARCDWHEGPEGVPILDRCENWFVGRVLARWDAGDHDAFLLEPVTGASRRRRASSRFHRAKRIDPGHDA